jgi:hypothetical protein
MCIEIDTQAVAAENSHKKHKTYPFLIMIFSVLRELRNEEGKVSPTSSLSSPLFFCFKCH